MKISFDFDSTLSEREMQKLAKKFVLDGHEVFVTTSRLHRSKAARPDWNDDLEKVCLEVGISLLNVRYTNGDDKWEILEGFDMHFDDDIYETRLINSRTDCVGVLISTEI